MSDPVPAITEAAATGETAAIFADHVLLHSTRRPEDWPDWFHAAGIDDIRIPQEIVLENSIVTCRAAINGLGIAIARVAFVADGLSNGRLVSPVRLPFAMGYGYYLVYPRERTRQRKIRIFQAWTAEQAAITRRQDMLDVH